MNLILNKHLLPLTMLLLSTSTVIGQKPHHQNPDTLIYISLKDFNQQIDTAIVLLQNKKPAAITGKEHIRIMMCLNTIFMAHDTAFEKRFTGSRYDKLLQLTAAQKYVTEIVKVYPAWIPNRGMGFYFIDLDMELYGTPRLYAWYQVKN